MLDEVNESAAMFKALDSSASIRGIRRMTLPEGHPDAVWVTDRGRMENDAALRKRIKEALSGRA